MIIYCYQWSFYRYHYFISKKRPICRCEQVQKINTLSVKPVSFWLYPDIFSEKIGYVSEISRSEGFRGHPSQRVTPDPSSRDTIIPWDPSLIDNPWWVWAHHTTFQSKIPMNSTKKKSSGLILKTSRSEQKFHFVNFVFLNIILVFILSIHHSSS